MRKLFDKFHEYRIKLERKLGKNLSVVDYLDIKSGRYHVD